MRNRGLVFLVLSALVAVAGSGFARADLIVTLEPFTTGGQPVSGPVAPGTKVIVDILLEVSAPDAPLPDLRLVQFDFGNTGAGIQLDSLEWAVDPNVYSAIGQLPNTSVVTLFMTSSPLLLTLTEEPFKIADVEVTVLASGTLDVIDTSNSDPSFGGDIRAGFPADRIFHRSEGNLLGGTLDFTVTTNGGGNNGGPPPADTDGDGVVDDVDHFPDDPDETTDTDDNGVGDNADPDDDGDGVLDDDDADPLDPNVGGENSNGNANGNDNSNSNGNSNDNGGGGSGGGAPRACGAGVLGPGLFLLMSLGLISFGTRRRDA